MAHPALVRQVRQVETAMQAKVALVASAQRRLRFAVDSMAAVVVALARLRRIRCHETVRPDATVAVAVAVAGTPPTKQGTVRTAIGVAQEVPVILPLERTEVPEHLCMAATAVA
jgi:hypothetical protein